jgi:hypothetical protein
MILEILIYLLLSSLIASTYVFIYYKENPLNSQLEDLITIFIMTLCFWPVSILSLLSYFIEIIEIELVRLENKIAELVKYVI